MYELNIVLAGLAAGVSFALSGFVKKQDEPFNFEKFFTTALVGAAAGVGQVIFQIEIDTSYSYLISMGFVPIFQNIVKAFNLKVVPKLKNMFFN